VNGSRLVGVARQVHQVIWGEFRGYDDKRSGDARITIVAFDSSWFEIRSDDVAVLCGCKRRSRMFDRRNNLEVESLRRRPPRLKAIAPEPCAPHILRARRCLENQAGAKQFWGCADGRQGR
jgi:hypothetical protein